MAKIVPLVTDDNVEKIYFDLEEDWHGYKSESVWGEVLDSNRYILRNVPFYVKGVSVEDHIRVMEKEGQLWFEEVVKHSGHSTYRIIITGDNALPELNEWASLEELGCTYEKGTGNLYAVDVPPTTDIYAVYGLLEQGEKEGFWEFEEGHCGHPV